MKLLVDTHVFLWHVTGDPKMPAAFRAAIQDAANEVFLSVASVWEAVIKHQLGKLPLPSPPAEYLIDRRVAHGIETLVVDEGTIAALSGLPAHHRDPFDRLIIAQAIQHDCTIATVDPEFAKYNVPLLAATTP